MHVRVYACTVQKNNKDTRHNEDLKAPRLGDNYREPTLQPSKGLNVKRYTSRPTTVAFMATRATRFLVVPSTRSISFHTQS